MTQRSFLLNSYNQVFTWDNYLLRHGIWLYAAYLEVAYRSIENKGNFLRLGKKSGSLAVELCELLVTWNVALKSLLHWLAIESSYFYFISIFLPFISDGALLSSLTTVSNAIEQPSRTKHLVPVHKTFSNPVSRANPVYTDLYSQ